MMRHTHHQIEMVRLQRRSLAIVQQVRQGCCQWPAAGLFGSQARQPQLRLIDAQTQDAVEREAFAAAMHAPARGIDMWASRRSASQTGTLDRHVQCLPTGVTQTDAGIDRVDCVRTVCTNAADWWVNEVNSRPAELAQPQSPVSSNSRQCSYDAHFGLSGWCADCTIAPPSILLNFQF